MRLLEDELDEIDVGLDRLRLKEIVCLELDTVSDVLGDIGVESWLDFWKVLDRDVQIRELACENDVIVATGSSKLKVGHQYPEPL